MRSNLPDRCVIDGEIVVTAEHGLDFEALQQRIHPAESRVRLLAEETPASFVAFDLLALGDSDLTGRSFVDRRMALEVALARGAGSGPRHAGHSRSGNRARVVRAIRRRWTGRDRRQAT